MRKILCILLASVLLVGMLTGCDAGNSENYLDPVYPPHYQKVYEELMGKDLDEVAQALGYDPKDFTYSQFEGFVFVHDTPVEFLGIPFHLGLHFRTIDAGTDLGGISYHTYLKESPEEMAAKVEYVAETLQKMFGYHYNGAPYSDPSQRENAFQDLDPQELAQKYAGDKEVGFSMTWLLTNKVSHIPHSTEQSAMLMQLLTQYNPEEGTVRIGLVCRLDKIYSNIFVRID